MKLKSLILCSFTLVAAFSLSGCGKDTTIKTEAVSAMKLNGVQYVALDKSGLVTTAGDKVSGSGSLVFLLPRPAENSNYTLTANLEPGGSVTLICNTDANLSTGVSVEFSRAANDKLVAKLIEPKKTFVLTGRTANHLPENINAAVPFSMNLDVHGHGDLTFFGFAKELEFNFNGLKTLFWGLKLIKATVTQAVAGNAKSNH